MIPLVHGRVAVLCWYGSSNTVTGTAPSFIFRIQDRDAATRIDRYRAVNCQWRQTIVSLETDRRPPLAPTFKRRVAPRARWPCDRQRSALSLSLPVASRWLAQRVNDPPPIPATRGPAIPGWFVWTRNGTGQTKYLSQRTD